MIVEKKKVMIYTLIYTKSEANMDTAKIFENGRSQAVRLPKEYRFDDSDVFIKKIDDVVMLIPRDKLWKTFRLSFTKFTSDLDLSRDGSDKPQDRDEIE
jgi:antitoxin VapB